MVGKVEAPAKANIIDPKAKNKKISKLLNKLNIIELIYTKVFS